MLACYSKFVGHLKLFLLIHYGLFDNFGFACMTLDQNTSSILKFLVHVTDTPCTSTEALKNLEIEFVAS